MSSDTIPISTCRASFSASSSFDEPGVALPDGAAVFVVGVPDLAAVYAPAAAAVNSSGEAMLPHGFPLPPISENIAQAVGAGHMDALNGGCKGFLIKFFKSQDIGSRLLQNVFRNLLAGTILSPLHIVGSAYPHRFGIGRSSHGDFTAVIAAALITAENAAERVSSFCFSFRFRS